MKANCICGNVQIEMMKPVEVLTSCNCFTCNRIGALWAYFKQAEVKVTCKQKPTVGFRHGDKYLEFQHCSICGCVTHYVATEKYEQDRMAINCRMVNLKQMQDLPIRYFDGADTWEFIENE